MKKLLWAVFGASLVLAGCSQPLEGAVSNRDPTGVPGPGIVSFSLAGVKGEIAGTSIYVREVPLYTAAQTLTDLRNAVPIIGYQGGTLIPAVDTPQNFGAPVIYTLLTDEGLQLDYTVVATQRPLRSAAEIEVYLPIAAKVYAGTEGEPIPLPMGLVLSAAAWRDILTAVETGGKYVALDLSACTASTDMTGGGLYGDYSFDAGPARVGESKVVSLVLPDEAKRIVGGTGGDAVFKRFTGLRSVVAAGVTEVGQSAFRGTGLTTVSLPAATTIGYDAFAGCIGLTTVSLPVARTIGEWAFIDCAALTRVSLPAAMTIGTYAFSDCTSLTTVTLPQAVTLYNYAFSNCSALEDINLPAVTNIGSYVFSDCDALSTINFPMVAMIGNYTFSGCEVLSTVSLPEARTIGGNAFSDCDALITISLPMVRTINSYAFFDCANLTTISLPEARTIGGYAFAGCDTLSNIDLPLARDISYSVFSECHALVTISLPEARIIGDSAFRSNENLRSVELPMAISMGSNVFLDCTSLSSVELPSATSLGQSLFGNTGTESLTIILGASPPTLMRSMFYGVNAPKTVIIKVPSGANYGDSLPLTYSASNSTVCWGNGFRGFGWDGSGFVSGGALTSNITLTIELDNT